MNIKHPCSYCNDTEVCDSGGTHPWGEAINIPCQCAPQNIDGELWWPFAHYEPVKDAHILIRALGYTNYHLQRENQLWRYCPTMYPYLPSKQKQPKHKPIATEGWTPTPAWHVTVYDTGAKTFKKHGIFRYGHHALMYADTLHVEDQGRRVLSMPVYVCEVGGALRVVGEAITLRETP